MDDMLDWAMMFILVVCILAVVALILVMMYAGATGNIQESSDDTILIPMKIGSSIILMPM